MHGVIIMARYMILLATGDLAARDRSVPPRGARGPPRRGACDRACMRAGLAARPSGAAARAAG